MQYKKLPVCGCSRRELLQGLGVAVAAIAIVPGCAQQGSSLPSAVTTSCGTNQLCIDLSVKQNAALANVGGALLVDTSSDTIMVIRQSSADVIALSAICTHAGCSMDFNAGAQQLTCPCHGSVFNEAGQVVQGPARRPLQTYSASLDSAGTTITLTL